MQIVIDIPEEIKQKRDAGKVLSNEEITTVCMAIKNGALLPTDAVDRVTIKEYFESFGKVTNVTVTDAVDRQAVLDQTYLWSKDEFLRVTNPFDYLRKRINSLPSVTPQPKMGRWITWKEAGNDIPSETRFECSVCHDAAQTLCNGLDLLSTYCPNCGAKMQGVKE